jgi:hypothetical protein
MASATLPPGGQSAIRIWNRELATYPERDARRMHLLLVVLITVTLYYELYVGGGVANDHARAAEDTVPDIRLHTCCGKLARGVRIAVCDLDGELHRDG